MALEAELVRRRHKTTSPFRPTSSANPQVEWAPKRVLESSHVPMLSQPEAVADVIVRAAASLKGRDKPITVTFFPPRGNAQPSRGDSDDDRGYLTNVIDHPGQCAQPVEITGVSGVVHDQR